MIKNIFFRKKGLGNEEKVMYSGGIGYILTDSIFMAPKNTSPRIDRHQVGEISLRPRITVVGVGGAGGNAVNNMIRAKLEGVEFIVANTDAQSLEQSLVPEDKRIQLGFYITQGLGAGSKPDVGRASAEESMDDILGHLRGSNMVFITGGMGGGTGTGAAPVIARAARESGILTVGVVTKPFHFEGAHRSRSAESGIDELQQYVDTLIVIPNQNLFRIANERTTFADAFKMADDVLYSGVRGVTDLMIMPGLINLDFADIRAVMAEMGKAMMGTGEAEGERRALDAAEAAISNPLLDDVSMKGARGVLINITGGYDMTLYEVDEAANRIRDDVDGDANIIFGSTFDERLNGRMRVSVVATGIGGAHAVAPRAHTNPILTPVTSPTPTMNPISVFERSNPIGTNVFPSHEANETPNHATLDAAQQEETAHMLHQQGPTQAYEEPANPAGDQRKRSPSLFERFTGVGRSKAHPVTEQTLKAPFPPSRPDASYTPSTQNTNTPAGPSHVAEEEDLEIPTFLRR